MKESTKMLLHYITGFGILIAGGVHLFTIFLTGSYAQALAFSGFPFSVIAVYRNLVFALTLELLLIFVDYHAGAHVGTCSDVSCRVDARCGVNARPVSRRGVKQLDCLGESQIGIITA